MQTVIGILKVRLQSSSVQRRATDCAARIAIGHRMGIDASLYVLLAMHYETYTNASPFVQFLDFLHQRLHLLHRPCLDHPPPSVVMLRVLCRQ